MGTIIFAFLIVIVAIVIAIAGDLKRMQASLGRRDYLTLLSAQERLYLAELRQYQRRTSESGSRCSGERPQLRT